RATDIPAFYADWFMNRLQKGYVKWTNPFNNKPQYISFRNTRLIVFWTKNPAPIIRHLDTLDKLGINFYFHFTLNDYEKEHFEKNVPSLKERISTFIELSSKIGKEKVLWRFDPVIMSKRISPEQILDRISFIGNQIHDYTNILTISFISMYEKVKRNFRNASVNDLTINSDTVDTFCKGLKLLNERLKLRIVSCAEKWDLKKYGIDNGACIDSGLISSVFGNDLQLNKFLGSNKPIDLFGSNAFNSDLKDPGQRPLCGCIASKDIGKYGTCPHLCLYCYANSTEKQVHNNVRNFKFTNDSL
ncbi:MAG: DUF1848 domain-containing protein, partial [Fibrobacter sp.]|nr:DUF1848 domain-containing protein [Fibrobacter sp.]